MPDNPGMMEAIPRWGDVQPNDARADITASEVEAPGRHDSQDHAHGEALEPDSVRNHGQPHSEVANDVGLNAIVDQTIRKRTRPARFHAPVVRIRSQPVEVTSSTMIRQLRDGSWMTTTLFGKIGCL